MQEARIKNIRIKTDIEPEMVLLSFYLKKALLIEIDFLGMKIIDIIYLIIKLGVHSKKYF